MNRFSGRLELLRQSLRRENINAYIIPSGDSHIGENIPGYWRIIPWLTGFTGSNATLVITDNFAGLWTDSRYFLQAERQISGTGFRLIRPESFYTNDYSDYLAEHLLPGSRIGFDGKIFSILKYRELKKKLGRLKITFDCGCDLISDIWDGRPPLPASIAYEHQLKYCGKERERKIAEVRTLMKEEGIDYNLLTSPDDIMWLLNIRGNDNIYSPVINSFALIGQQQILLFANENQIPPLLCREFDKLGIVILPYDEVTSIVDSVTVKSTVLFSPGATSVALFDSIAKDRDLREGISIPSKLKAVKNMTEIANISETMKKDGTALTKFLFWLENEAGESITEISLSEKLFSFRSGQEGFIGNSFSPIIAFNDHSALPHYDPTECQGSPVEKDGILLIDSGGHYLGGTTDITRTVSTGRPTDRQKRDFTLVLKGHINLATAKFPEGTKGYQLDILARKALWEHGMNYGHGTGHGVGYFLNVHEGPVNISTSANRTIIEPGMLISDEPAIYREGEYGIRTENLLLCYEDEETTFGQFLRFETMSLCHIDKKLIDRSLLDNKEIRWINSYHSLVFDKLSPFLTAKEKAWLQAKAEPL